jgi:LmbE family N-acetylglucosaminyl deacetylase
MSVRETEGREPSGTLLIAAHADDAAFSVGGALLKHAIPLPVTAVTVFTRTDYAPYLASANQMSVDEITRISTEEDKAYFSGLGINVVHLGFLDAPLRGYSEAGNPFLKERPGKSIFGVKRSIDDPIFQNVRDRISQTVSGFRGSHLALPLGLGCHVDHLITSDACLSANTSLKSIYYEDVPYSVGYPIRRIDSIAHSIDSSVRVQYVELGQEIEQKVRNLGVYVSQVGSESSLAATYARRLGRNKGPVERLWFSGKDSGLGPEERRLSPGVSRRTRLLDAQYRRIAKGLKIRW